MTTTRAKFRCNSVQNYGPNAPLNYEFSAVTDPDAPEAERFTKYTPSGKLTIAVDNPAVSFSAGKNYYLDFTEAE